MNTGEKKVYIRIKPQKTYYIDMYIEINYHCLDGKNLFTIVEFFIMR